MSRASGLRPEALARVPRLWPSSRGSGLRPEALARVPRLWPASRGSGPRPEAVSTECKAEACGGLLQIPPAAGREQRRWGLRSVSERDSGFRDNEGDTLLW
ncbi:hypothetical protein CgunFtcFv8_027582 [Champsocephalus gunnari]|uniref:Uncharacterized protein n=1 Tax=Champsocephalus gunnari TaxID=52237 RepID=A0AAN8I415_CHAGU|nr:hypothetical protein CgunFtcFv8_027582 [Champsocephalus gunnari]